jgi:hypothetical protein
VYCIISGNGPTMMPISPSRTWGLLDSRASMMQATRKKYAQGMGVIIIINANGASEPR